jgi:hypothetical protein
MARQKSVNLKLKFHTSYNTHPITIKHKGLTVENEIDIFLENVDQKEYVEFSGFDYKDKAQEVICSIFYKNQTLDVEALCSFQMKNNKYVNNIKLSKYHKIYFNGELELKFFKEWFECNLLSGAYINNKKRFLHRWVIDYKNNNLRSEEEKKYDVFCIGCSVTYGTSLEKQDTWPELLSERLDCSVANFGVPGMSIHGCLRQALYCLENFHVEKMIVLLPPFGRILHKFEFLGNKAYYNYTSLAGESKVNFFDRKKNNNKIISHSERFGKRIIKRFAEMSRPNLQIYLTSWDKDVYNFIPHGDNKLPQYPNLDIYKERAPDGHHPHYKHNELFVDLISDRI